MFNFYESLDTLKEVKKPTRKEVINMTIAIFIVVIISGIFMIIIDFAFMQVSKLISAVLGG